jgi:hypothetical protein
VYPLSAGPYSSNRFSADDITLLNGTLYVNNVFSNNLYRIPVDGAGKAGQPCDQEERFLAARVA